MDDAARTCGDCGLCCRLMGVKSIGKAPLDRCTHFNAGAGCGVYQDRPGECRAFVCEWLKKTELDDRWRPDRSRFILHLENDGRRLCVEVDPTRPDAWRKAPFHQAIRDWAARGAASGLEVVVWAGRRGWRIQPWGEVDMGHVRVEAA